MHSAFYAFMEVTHTHLPTSRTDPYIEQERQYRTTNILETLLGYDGISACSVWMIRSQPNHRVCPGGLAQTASLNSDNERQTRHRHGKRQAGGSENREMICTPTESMNARHGMDPCMLLLVIPDT